MEENRVSSCRPIVERVLAERHWTLVQDFEAFLHEVSVEAQQRLTGRRTFEEAVQLAVVNRYSVVIYDACASPDRGRQKRAFEELGRRLEIIANYKGQPPDLVFEFRQAALEKIWKNLHAVKDQSAFFDYCNKILLHLIADYYRERKQHEFSWSELESEEGTGESLENQMSELRDGPAQNPEPERDELRQEVSAAIRACLKHELYYQVVIGLFLDEKSLLEVAEQLGLTPNYVNVIKFRASKALRACEDFNRLYQEWLS